MSAFTPDERAQVRMYLGYSGRFLQTDNELDRALDATDNKAADQTIVRAQLAECVRIDAALTAAEGRLKASKAGPIELNGAEIEQLRDRGRQAVARLARQLGVPARGDAFEGSLPTTTATPWGPLGGGGYQMQG
jgi:hypothetical protein